jgi:hypothetical protein
MKKNFNRQPYNWKRIYFNKKKIISKNSSTFLKKYNVHSLINILKPDFKLIKKHMKLFTHFNIQESRHIPGKNYLIVKIDKAGYYDGKVYKQPIISSNNFILAKCLSVKENVDYSDLKKKDFEHSLSNIKSVSSLKRTIKRRYKKSLAHLSDSKKLSLGVGITKLRIFKRY